jgi:hypothetical protein
MSHRFWIAIPVIALTLSAGCGGAPEEPFSLASTSSALTKMTFEVAIRLTDPQRQQVIKNGWAYLSVKYPQPEMQILFTHFPTWKGQIKVYAEHLKNLVNIEAASPDLVSTTWGGNALDPDDKLLFPFTAMRSLTDAERTAIEKKGEGTVKIGDDPDEMSLFKKLFPGFKSGFLKVEAGHFMGIVKVDLNMTNFNELISVEGPDVIAVEGPDVIAYIGHGSDT